MIQELIERLSKEASKKGLPFLLIGGHAIARLGHARMTLDVDFLVRSDHLGDWESVLNAFGYTCYSQGNAFAQFSGKLGWPRVDLMLVPLATFVKLAAEAVGSTPPLTPSPRHIVALKLHAARSPDRSKPEQDWEDIRQMVTLHLLNPADSGFRDLILRYGGDPSLARIQEIWQTFSSPDR